MSRGKKIVGGFILLLLLFVVLLVLSSLFAPDRPEDLTDSRYTAHGTERAGPRAALEELDGRDDSITGLVIECETIGQTDRAYLYLQRTWDEPQIFPGTESVLVRWGGERHRRGCAEAVEPHHRPREDRLDSTARDRERNTLCSAVRAQQPVDHHPVGYLVYHVPVWAAGIWRDGGANAGSVRLPVARVLRDYIG